MKRLQLFGMIWLVAIATLVCTKDRPTDPTQQTATAQLAKKRNRPSVYRVGGCSFHSIERVGQLDTLLNDSLAPNLASCDTIFFAAADTFDLGTDIFVVDSVSVVIMGGTDPARPLLKSTYTGSSAVMTFEPGSPWENGYIESFNGKLRDELLNGEIFYTLIEAQVLIERWRREYNWKRPHSSLGYRPPAPVAIEAAAA